ncbi:MAG: PfkB family carbohydrate kinase [Egibacteraceae bacterium]
MAVDLVIIGHLARNENITPTGTKVSDGGSAYYAAVGASVISPERVGVIAPIGMDFDLTSVIKLGVNREGITSIIEGNTPQFIIAQHSDGSRTFHAEWGVADHTPMLAFPRSYASAGHVHLATAPPHQQLAWLHQLRKLKNRPIVSVDTFEHFAQVYPNESRKVCQLADIVFMNEAERQLLGVVRPWWSGATILKRGALGARYMHGTAVYEVPAPSVSAIDTTGAGDVLAGAFLALRSAGVHVGEALAEAVSIATASVVDFGMDGVDLRLALGRTRHLAESRRTIG